MLSLPADAVIDVEVAFDAIRRAEAALERSDWEDAAGAAAITVSVADRGLLPGLDGDWVAQQRARLDEVRLRALECLADCGLAVGGARLSSTERAARALIADAPYRETGYGYLMQALAGRNRVAEALMVFDDVRRLLLDELGTPPGAGLRSLYERLLSEHGRPPATERDDPLAGGAATAPALTPIALPTLLLTVAGRRLRTAWRWVR